MIALHYGAMQQFIREERPCCPTSLLGRTYFVIDGIDLPATVLERVGALCEFTVFARRRSFGHSISLRDQRGVFLLLPINFTGSCMLMDNLS